jgi:hypothetical protein
MNRLSPVAVDTPRSSAQSTAGESSQEIPTAEHEATLANGALPASEPPFALDSSEAKAQSPIAEILSALSDLFHRSKAAGISSETTVSEVALTLPPLPPVSSAPATTPNAEPQGFLSTLVTPEIEKVALKKPAKNRQLSPEQVIEALHRELPVGMELHRAYHYQVPFSKKSRLDVVVLKLYCPQELEQKLNEWRLRMDDRFDSVTILVRRVTVDQNMVSHLRNRFRETSLLTDSAIPTLRDMIASICGSRPTPPVVISARQQCREDLTAIPFVAIDRPGTRDVEDLLHAERKPNGELIWRTAFINATGYVEPGSQLDRYALRVGSTIYGRSTTIPTLGEYLSHDLLSFKVGALRPAWVIEGRLTPRHVTTSSGRTRVEYTLQYKVRSGVVINRKNIDPAEPIDTAATGDALSKSLSALAEVTRILQQQRTSHPALLRIEGESAASKIVAETMIESKRILAQFLGSRHGVPAIYRVHHKPSAEVVNSFVNELGELGIPASPPDFENPAEFAGILRSLENVESMSAQTLLNNLIDTYLLRSMYSTKNEGHFGLRLDGYLEIKPRDASGLANQFQLSALFEGRSPLTALEMSRRAAVLNEKRWRRDELNYKLRFLEMLHGHLADVDSKTFLATVVKTKRTTPYLEVEGFSKWGVLDGVPEGEYLEKGSPVAVKLKGFDLNRMRFRFEYVR